MNPLVRKLSDNGLEKTEAQNMNTPIKTFPSKLDFPCLFGPQDRPLEPQILARLSHGLQMIKNWPSETPTSRIITPKLINNLVIFCSHLSFWPSSRSVLAFLNRPVAMHEVLRIRRPPPKHVEVERRV